MAGIAFRHIISRLTYLKVENSEILRAVRGNRYKVKLAYPRADAVTHESLVIVAHVYGKNLLARKIAYNLVFLYQRFR